MARVAQLAIRRPFGVLVLACLALVAIRRFLRRAKGPDAAAGRRLGARQNDLKTT